VLYEVRVRNREFAIIYFFRDEKNGVKLTVRIVARSLKKSRVHFFTRRTS